ncbi:MAG TPA: hypothetical protein VG753_02895, partial [Candidatus Paceibacterota bacterium]|nr:hypothetical protein [Candidatus Paceibacterota bacterium]
ENIRHTSRGNSGRKNLRGGRKESLWGAISKTNHPVLRWRDPVYKSVRELAMSYFHEYFLPTTGRKTLYAYSKPFDLSKVAPECWVTSEGSLDWLAETLDASPHYPVAPKSILRRARRASMLEREASKLAQWHKPAKRTWGLS